MKRLLLVGLFVADARATVQEYVRRLGLREVGSRSANEGGTTECVLLAGAQDPPWVAVFSHRGLPREIKGHDSDVSDGLQWLVYLTDRYAEEAGQLLAIG